MPTAKEKWEQQYEEYRDTIVSLGGVILKETAFKSAYKIYREKIPERIYKLCVDEKGGQTPAPQPKTPVQTQTQGQDQMPPRRQTTPPEPATGHAETPDNGREKKRKTQKERFEDYKANLARKNIIIKDETELFNLFKSIRGRLDYSQIGEFVTFPERKPHDRDNDRNPREDRDRNNDRKDKRDEKKQPSNPAFDDYREGLIAQGYEIIDQNQLARLFNKQKGFISPEQLQKLVRKAPENNRVINNAAVSSTAVPVPTDTKLPVVVEGSFADKWIKPLQKWCDTDLNKDGKPKRHLTPIQADDHSTIIDIIPTSEYSAENPQDAGARYSFAKVGSGRDIDVHLGSKDDKPLDYEYFRQMILTSRENGIRNIAFKDISTDEFRDKLLAAALEFDMTVQNAPQKVDLNAPHLKKLPNAVKIKLGIYNGDLAPSGKPISEIKNSIIKQKENHNGGNSSEKPGISRPQLALPIHISPRERD